jgi:hypothetical protein
MLGQDMIDCQVGSMPAAILTGVMIAAENFTPDGFNMRPGSVDHFVKPNHGWERIGLNAGVDEPSAICDQGGFFTNDQIEGPANITDIDWLKITVEHQNLL